MFRQLIQGAWTSSRHSPIVMALLCTAICGCGNAQAPWEKAYPVRGSLIWQGKPVANAVVSLFPEDPAVPDSVRPRAKTADDGSFEVWTYQPGDGAPAGRYKLTVVREAVDVVRDVVVVKPNDLPGKFSRLETTDLQVEIQAAATELPPITL